MLPPMPGNVDPNALPPEQRAVLMRFATEVAGTPFIPALYRQIAHWPPVLAWLAGELGPRLAAPKPRRRARHSRVAARDARRSSSPACRACLGEPPDADTRRVLAAIERYAETSPEMTMFGQLMLDALPLPEAL